MGYQGHKGQNRVVENIIRRAGLGAQEYLQSGHPDAFFRDGVRREIKSHADRLSSDQRKQLEWMTAAGQPWEILKETHSGKILRFRTLDAYDLYHEYKTGVCDWTVRVLPLGTVLGQRTRRGTLELQTKCAACPKLVWNTVSRLRTSGLTNIVCLACHKKSR
jgi:hypothetical protein